MVLPLAETVPDTLLAGKGFWAVGNVAFRRGDAAAGLRYHQRAAALLSPRLDVGLWASFNKASASMRLASGLHDEQTLARASARPRRPSPSSAPPAAILWT